MKFISTRDLSHAVDFKTALLHGLAPDGGLYIPSEIPRLPPDFFSTIDSMDLHELGFQIIKLFLPDIPESILQKIIEESLSFPIPLKKLNNQTYLLEVFHGPTLAFKDVGARFMARILSYFLNQEKRKISILVATSGDTGSAIAHGFHKMENIDVFVLYPSEKISRLQEQQMTTLGDNIHVLEVLGTFDDCQKLVKQALLDDNLSRHRLLTTANSINITRILAQIIYHSWGVVQLHQLGEKRKPILSVPSGNFGNLTAALYAKRMGIPIQHFIAATNKNAIVPLYLKTGKFKPRASQKTYSNAMDVGNPSNFERMQVLYQHELSQMQAEITGIPISDKETLETIAKTYQATQEILDPHSAVGLAAAEIYQQSFSSNTQPIIVTATAHPAKFQEVITEALKQEIPLPASLQKTLNLKKKTSKILPNYVEFQKILIK